MNSSPLVSIVIPTFNRLEFLPASIESVYAQTFSDWELIIVDDGSDIETRSYLAKLQNARTTVVLHEHTGRPAVIRNLGISRARGRYVAFLDSDDLWLPKKLHRQVELMASFPERRWCYTGFRVIDSEDNILLPSMYSKFVPYAGSIVKELLECRARVAAPTIMAETSLLRELDGFDEHLRFSEDYDLWLRMALVSDVGVDPAPLCSVRRHEDHFTDNKSESMAGFVALFRKMERLMPTHRLRYISRKQRGKQSLRLAALYGQERDWNAMRRALVDAFRGRAFSPKDWLIVVRSVALRR